jgi:hypothetical protein
MFKGTQSVITSKGEVLVKYSSCSHYKGSEYFKEEWNEVEPIGNWAKDLSDSDWQDVINEVADILDKGLCYG